MEITEVSTTQERKDFQMPGQLISHIPRLLEEREMKPMDLVRLAAKYDVILSVQTAYDLAKGELDITVQTLEKMCTVFNLPIEQIVTYIED